MLRIGSTAGVSGIVDEFQGCKAMGYPYGADNGAGPEGELARDNGACCVRQSDRITILKLQVVKTRSD
ncbi:hypothetical protein D3C87_1954810 [compost metagenome]